MKAFVFKDIFWADKTKQDLQEDCDSCFSLLLLESACKGEKNTLTDARCLPSPTACINMSYNDSKLQAVFLLYNITGCKNKNNVEVICIMFNQRITIN